MSLTNHKIIIDAAEEYGDADFITLEACISEEDNPRACQINLVKINGKSWGDVADTADAFDSIPCFNSKFMKKAFSKSSDIVANERVSLLAISEINYVGDFNYVGEDIDYKMIRKTLEEYIDKTISKANVGNIVIALPDNIQKAIINISPLNDSLRGIMLEDFSIPNFSSIEGLVGVKRLELAEKIFPSTPMELSEIDNSYYFSATNVKWNASKKLKNNL